MNIKGGQYLTAEQYRQKRGYSDIRSIYKMIKNGRLDGCIKFNDRWMIPATALPLDRRRTTGEFIGWRERYGNKEEE